MADCVPGSAVSVASVETSVMTLSPSDADLAWSLTNEDGDIDMTSTVRRGWCLKALRLSLGEAFKTTVKQHGGARQFLQKRYPTKVSKVDYAKKLWLEFPPLDSSWPTLCEDLPACVEEGKTVANVHGVNQFLHLAQLDFSEQASFRGPPGLLTCCQLADEILTDGFVTKEDRLLVTRKDYLSRDAGDQVPGPWPDQDQGKPTVPAFAMGFVKGAARICTLHTLVTLLFDDEISVREAYVGGCKVHGAQCNALLGVGGLVLCGALLGEEDPVQSTAWSNRGVPLHSNVGSICGGECCDYN
jgi:hypothetical protein